MAANAIEKFNPLGGRPKKPDARYAGVRFRVTHAELATLQARAATAGVSLADYARAAALKGRRTPAREQGGAVVPELKMDPKTYLQLSGVARNLNQLARHCNTHNVPPPAEMVEALREIRALLIKAHPANGA